MARVKSKARVSYSTPKRNMTKRDFVKMVKKAKRYNIDAHFSS